MIILDPEEQVRCKEIINRDTHLFEAGRQDLQAIFFPGTLTGKLCVWPFCLSNISVNRVFLHVHEERDRCRLLAITGMMTHFSPAESFIKCPKYEGYNPPSPLPFPACDQLLISFLIKTAKGERFSFLIWVR